MNIHRLINKRQSIWENRLDDYLIHCLHASSILAIQFNSVQQLLNSSNFSSDYQITLQFLSFVYFTQVT